MKKLQVVALIVLVIYISYVNNLIIVPERAGVSYYNPKYMENFTVNVRRNGRKSPYIINCNITTLFTVHNNVLFEFVFFEYLHNEYRRSFVEFHKKGCTGIIEDQLFHFGAILKPRGIRCPMPPGRYVLSNMTFNEVPYVNQMTYKWPFEKAKGVVKAYYIPGNELLAEVYCVLRFLQNPSIAKEKA